MLDTSECIARADTAKPIYARHTSERLARADTRQNQFMLDTRANCYTHGKRLRARHKSVRLARADTRQAKNVPDTKANVKQEPARGRHKKTLAREKATRYKTKACN